MGEQLSLFSAEELAACGVEARVDVYHYTEDDEEVIRRQWHRRTDRDLADDLLRTPEAVRKKRRRMGIRKRKPRARGR